MRLLYAVLLCIVCAPAPRQYLDGAPLRPPVPSTTFTPPGTGLPEYWGPPEAKPDVQPNPRPKRVLPPSREPGIWAADNPKASSDPDTKPELFRLPVPLPEDGQEAPTARLCTNDLGHAAIDTGDWPGAAKLPEPMRQCLIGHLMARCADQEAERLKKTLPEGHHLRRQADATHAAAVRHKVKACKVAPLDADAEAMRDRILDQWRRNQ